MAEVKLPLRKSNVWISVKVDMETHLRLPRVSREEIKPETDGPAAGGERLGGRQVGGHRARRGQWRGRRREPGGRGARAGAPRSPAAASEAGFI